MKIALGLLMTIGLGAAASMLVMDLNGGGTSKEFMTILLILLGSALLGAMLIFSYPTLLKRIALALYRHADKTEKMNLRHAQEVNQKWRVELEER